MYIVGTSGHIDHGKTALIKALTGIDCDRLPEEKQRAMTIDIGFSSIEYPRLGTVSIIDVPGHERFIRNMVAGAWGVDLALLVIAVDDGWMPQTEDHYRVIELLGIERLVVVLNKIDLADEEMIEFVEEEVREKLGHTRFNGSDIVHVSAKTGKGIDELKTAIRRNLEKLRKAPNADKPYLFIDRVFASKGYGTVITGTLKNGVFRDDDMVEVLPSGKETRIKKIESHYQDLHEGAPSQRTALNLSGISIDEVKRGHIIVKNNFFSASRDIVARIRVLEEKRELKNNLGIEVLIGTYREKGKLILLDEVEEKKREITARIKFERPWHFYPGQPFIITNPGGYRIIGGGTVLIVDRAAVKDKKSFKEKLNLLSDLSRPEVIEFIIRINNAIRKDDFLAHLPDNSKVIDKILKELQEKGSIVEIEGFLVDRPFLDSSKENIAGAIKKNVGLNLKEISDLAGVDASLVRILIAPVLQDFGIVEKEGRYFAGDSITVDTLPEDKKKSLSIVRARGAEGIELDKEKDDSLKRNIKELVKLGFVVSLDGNIVYHSDVYGNLKDKVMKLLEDRDKITVPEAKDATNLSRKFIIPLLNRIETDGLIKRIGDFRMKA